MAVENDLVLIHYEDKPLSFARIEEILADHKPDWYHVRLLLLQAPLQEVTWILRTAYINGESFTMEGKKMRLELVKRPSKQPPAPAEASRSAKEGGKVISLASMKKR
jgi:hypothetical protein